MKKMLKHITTSLVVVSLIGACNNQSNKNASVSKENVEHVDSVGFLKSDSDTSLWRQVKPSKRIHLKMAYADTANFMHQKMYPCAVCLLRKEVAFAIQEAAILSEQENYKLILFDCYRPLSIQKKMFDLIGDERYVANPQKGSVHNRGCAVDISLTDVQGNLLDMGSAFDAFDESSAYDYKGLTDAQVRNRRILREIMVKAGFNPYEPEWWHFNFKDCKHPLSNQQLICH